MKVGRLGFKTALLVGSVAFLCIPQIVYSAVTALELKALTDIYNTMGGSAWVQKTRWKTGDPCAQTWAGVTCTGGSVTTLNFNSNNLVGSLPSSVIGLQYLIEFFAYGNSIVGNITTIFKVLPPSLTAM